MSESFVPHRLITAAAVAAGAGLIVGGARRVAQLRPALDAVAPDLRHPVLYISLNLDDRRLAIVRKLQSFTRSPTTTAIVAERMLPATTAAPSVRVLTYEPADRERPSGALLWIHGGGMVMGTPEENHQWCSDLADELGIVVVNVDYRLAPEHPFPAALDDCMAALGWMHDQADELGIDPTRVAVGGASAGGGLAASVCQRARSEGGPQIAFQLLNYPMLDDRTVLVDDREHSEVFTWTEASNRFAWNSYLGGGEATGDRALAAPGRTADLAGLPPAWIGVGDLDLFWTEDLDYARRLDEAGVPCELDTVEGMYHGADTLVPDSAISKDYRASMIAALRNALT